MNRLVILITLLSLVGNLEAQDTSRQDRMQFTCNCLLEIQDLRLSDNYIEKYTKCLLYNFSEEINNFGNNAILLELRKYCPSILIHYELKRIDNSSDSLFEIGLEYSQVDKMEEAIVYFDLALEHNPNNLQAKFQKGVALYFLSRHFQALKLIDEVLIYGNNSNARLIKGLSYKYLQKENLALNEFQQIKPDSLTVQNKKEYFRKLGETCLNLGEYNLSIAALTKSINLNPEDIFSYNLRSYAFQAVGKFDSSLMDISTVLNMDSTDTAAMLNEAFVFMEFRKLEKANVKYKKLNKIMPNNPFVLSNYGYLKHLEGKSAEGESMILNSLELDSLNSFAYKYLARISIDNKKLSKACEYIKKGIALGYTERHGLELFNLKNKYCK